MKFKKRGDVAKKILPLGSTWQYKRLLSPVNNGRTKKKRRSERIQVATEQ